MTALLTRHFDYVHAVCRRILRDPGDAEDARQDALIRAARHVATFDGCSKFTAAKPCAPGCRGCLHIPTRAAVDGAGNGYATEHSINGNRVRKLAPG